MANVVKCLNSLIWLSENSPKLEGCPLERIAMLRPFRCIGGLRPVWKLVLTSADSAFQEVPRSFRPQGKAETTSGFTYVTAADSRVSRDQLVRSINNFLSLTRPLRAGWLDMVKTSDVFFLFTRSSKFMYTDEEIAVSTCHIQNSWDSPVHFYHWSWIKTKKTVGRQKEETLLWRKKKTEAQVDLCCYW